MKKDDVAEANADDPDVCATVGCDRPAALTYLGRPRCQPCYQDDVAADDETSNESPNHEGTEMAETKKKTTPKSAKKTTKTVKARKVGKASQQQPTPTQAKAAPKPAPAAKPKRVSALDAAAQVLQKADTPMSSKALIAAMAERNLWKSPAGKTPHATLYAAVLREISAKGAQARFRKADRGLFEYAGAE